LSRSPTSRSISAELLALKDRAGLIHAPKAVEWARENPDSMLHDHLEWDDKKAAESHRVWQVRQLIALHVVNDEGDRLLVSLSIDRGDGGYRPLDDVLAAPALKDVMLQDALRDLDHLKRKYARLNELVRVWDAAQQAAKDAAKGPRKRPARLPMARAPSARGTTARQ
jgi:hypothetical protein